MNCWFLFLTLMLDAVVSCYVTGSAWHFLLILVVTGALELAGVCRWSRNWIAAMAVPVAAASALAGWLAFHGGLAIALFTPLPWTFHLALGIHLWAWIVLRWEKKEAFSAITAPMVMLAGILIARVPAVEEIYGAAPWLVRALGMAVLVMSCLAAFSTWANPVEGRWAGTAAAGAARSRDRKGIAGLIGVIAASLLLGLLLHPAQGLASKLYLWYGERGEVTRLDGFDARGSAEVSGVGATDGSSRQLPSEADIRLDRTVRFFVEWGSGEEFAEMMRRPVYFRAMTLPVFLSDSELAPLRKGEWRYDSDDGQEDGRVRLRDPGEGESSLSRAGREVRYSILMDRRDMRALPLIASPEQLDLAGCYEFADGWYQLALEEEQDRVSFSARSRTVRLEELSGQNSLRTDSVSAGEYVAVPDSPLVERIGEWLEENGISRETGTLREKLNAIRTLLSGRCAYRLRFRNPEGRSPIDNFLFGEKAGHCELFASASVLILRKLGIPSRAAYGFCGGVARPGARMVAFRECDFHAWAEVYLEDHGWVVFDTTPLSRGAARPPERSGSGVAFAGFDRKTFENLSRDFEFQPVERNLLRGWLMRLLDWMARFIAWICLALAVVVFFLIRSQSRDRGKAGPVEGIGIWGSRAGPVRKTPGFLSDYLETFAEMGSPKSAGETFLEFLQSMKQRGFCKGEFDEMIRYVYRVRYEGRDRDSAAEKRFREVVKQFRKNFARQAATRGEEY